MYMLDTNICIYAIKKKPEKTFQRVHEELNGSIFISSITLCELEYGVRNSSMPEKNEESLLKFLAPATILAFDGRAASEYGNIRAYLQRLGTLIGAMDMLIAAHARAEKLVLVTNNEREFRRVPGLVIENWA